MLCTHQHAEGYPHGPRVEDVREVLPQVADDPPHPPEGQDEAVEQELGQFLPLVVHGWGFWGVGGYIVVLRRRRRLGDTLWGTGDPSYRGRGGGGGLLRAAARTPMAKFGQRKSANNSPPYLICILALVL